MQQDSKISGSSSVDQDGDSSMQMESVTKYVIDNRSVDAWFNILKDRGYFQPDKLSSQSDEFNVQYCKKLLSIALAAFAKADRKVTQDSEFVVLDFTEIIGNSPWAELLSEEHVKMLHYLACQRSLEDPSQMKASEFVSSIDIFRVFLWLGDPTLADSQAIPAHIAIQFICHFLEKNDQAKREQNLAAVRRILSLLSKKCR